MIEIPPYEPHAWRQKSKWWNDLAPHLPLNPGVYFLFDKDKNLIYIGQSINLRSRIFSQVRHNPSVKFVSWRMTHSVEELAHLESLLITKYRPVLNKDIPKLPCIYFKHKGKEKPKGIFEYEYVDPFPHDEKRVRKILEWGETPKEKEILERILITLNEL